MTSWIAIALLAGLAAAGGRRDDPPGEGRADDRAAERARMVAEQIERRGVRDARVLEAMRRIPRHAFVPPSEAPFAYEDRPLPVGWGQTISQPYIVALMTEALRVRPHHRVLEIGTGTGYQTAVLAALCDTVWTIEIVEPLAREARARLDSLGVTNVRTRIGDGWKGWPEAAPFDRIIVTAAPETLPQALVDQLADGGRMVIPVGDVHQVLLEVTREGDRVRTREITAVRFVPMVHGDGE